jgi:hypothetical protein
MTGDGEVNRACPHPSMPTLMHWMRMGAVVAFVAVGFTVLTACATPAAASGETRAQAERRADEAAQRRELIRAQVRAESDARIRADVLTCLRTGEATACARANGSALMRSLRNLEAAPYLDAIAELAAE